MGLGVAMGILLVAALSLLYTFNPETQPLFPRCPFLLITGYQCPGCGSQRALHSLLHGNIGAAFKQNVFMVLSIPYVFLGIYLQYFGGKQRHPQLESIFYGRWSAIIVLCLIIGYWILRNIL